MSINFDAALLKFLPDDAIDIIIIIIIIIIV